MENMVIRAIFFDYDGVLTTDKNGSLTTYRYLSEASGIAFSTISAAFSPYGGDLFTGRLSNVRLRRRVPPVNGRAAVRPNRRLH